MGRRIELLDEVVGEINATGTGATALALQLDVSDRAAVAAQLGSLPIEFADVDVRNTLPFRRRFSLVRNLRPCHTF